MKLNDSQKYLLPLVDKYQTLLKAIGDSIMQYRDNCDIFYKISQEEIDWLIFRFYPALQQNLENFLPFDQAKDIRQTIDTAHNVLVNLSDSVGFEKYLKGPYVSQDLKLLMDANISADKILEGPILLNNEQGANASGQKKQKDNTYLLSKEAMATFILKEHPEWTDGQIAKAVGVQRTTLYKWPFFKMAKAIRKQAKRDMPQGSKDADGTMHAWDKP